MAYENVQRALENLGNSIRGGFKDLSNARMSAAKVALAQAQQEHQIRKEEYLFPQRKFERDKAVYENQKLEDLKNTAVTANSFMSGENGIFNKHNKDFEVQHYIENDITGIIMEVTDTRYDQQADRFYDKDGNVLTEYDLRRARPVIQGLIVQETDPIKRLEDIKQWAIDNNNNEVLVKVNEELNDTQVLLNYYDQQEQMIINYLNNMKSRLPSYMYKDYEENALRSLDRIERKRGELRADYEFNRRLRLEGRSTDKSMSQYQMSETMRKIRADVVKEVDGELAARRERGEGIQMNVYLGEDGVVRDSAGQDVTRFLTQEQYNEMTGKGLTNLEDKQLTIPMPEAYLQAWRRREIDKRTAERTYNHFKSLGMLPKSSSKAGQEGQPSRPASTQASQSPPASSKPGDRFRKPAGETQTTGDQKLDQELANARGQQGTSPEERDKKPVLIEKPGETVVYRGSGKEDLTFTLLKKGNFLVPRIVEEDGSLRVPNKKEKAIFREYLQRARPGETPEETKARLVKKLKDSTKKLKDIRSGETKKQRLLKYTDEQIRNLQLQALSRNPQIRDRARRRLNELKEAGRIKELNPRQLRELR